MRASIQITAISALMAFLLGVTSVAADVLTVSPGSSLALPTDESGVSRVALLFDFSEMRRGSGRRIDAAFLEWQLDGVASDKSSEFSAFVLSAIWDKTTARSLALTAEQQEPAGTWEVEPLDFTRGQGGVVRLDLRDVVGEWTSGGRGNYGIVLSTKDVSSKILASQLSKAKLTVLYGFLK